jgi:hypothetical protein
MLLTLHRCTRRAAMRAVFGATVALAGGSLLSACTATGPARGQGTVTAAVELQQLVDTRFADAAVQELGVNHV